MLARLRSGLMYSVVFTGAVIVGAFLVSEGEAGPVTASPGPGCLLLFPGPSYDPVIIVAVVSAPQEGFAPPFE